MRIIFARNSVLKTGLKIIKRPGIGKKRKEKGLFIRKYDRPGKEKLMIKRLEIMEKDQIGIGIFYMRQKELRSMIGRSLRYIRSGAKDIERLMKEIDSTFPSRQSHASSLPLSRQNERILWMRVRDLVEESEKLYQTAQGYLGYKRHSSEPGAESADERFFLSQEMEAYHRNQKVQANPSHSSKEEIYYTKPGRDLL